MPIGHCTAFQIFELDWTLPPSLSIPQTSLQGICFFITATAKMQLHKDRASWKGTWCDLVVIRNSLELIVHVVFESHWVSQCFFWVFRTLPYSCAFAVTPQDASVHSLGILFGNNPSLALSSYTAYLILNTPCSVSELIVCACLMSATRSSALWSSESIPCTYPGTACT